MRDLRKDRGADTALDLESYDAHHDVTLASAETLFRHYEARLHSLGPGGALPILEPPPRHKYEIPENVSRKLKLARDREALRITHDE